MTDADMIKTAVRERYGALARELRAEAPEPASCCGPADASAAPPSTRRSFGCGDPVVAAGLRSGQVVLDLGSGPGVDVLAAAEKVGPAGKVYGLDMTDEMLAVARANQDSAGLTNVEFLKGDIESIPLPDASVDVVISNCVINLAADKPAVLAEAHRVLRPGGWFAVADIVTDVALDEAERADLASWASCVAGALTGSEYHRGLERAGFSNIEITDLGELRPNLKSALITAIA